MDFTFRYNEFIVVSCSPLRSRNGIDKVFLTIALKAGNARHHNGTIIIHGVRIGK